MRFAALTPVTLALLPGQPPVRLLMDADPAADGEAVPAVATALAADVLLPAAAVAAALDLALARARGLAARGVGVVGGSPRLERVWCVVETEGWREEGGHHVGRLGGVAPASAQPHHTARTTQHAPP